MNRNHTRTGIALVAGCAAALMGPAASGAQDLPSVGVNVQVGQLGAGFESENIRRDVNSRADSTLRATLAGTQRRLRATESRLRSLERKLQGELSARKAQADEEIASRRKATLRTVSRLQTDARRLRTKVMQDSIALASSSADGAWVAVDRTANILNQSGGARVSHDGRGLYTVAFDTSRSGCASLAGSGASPSGNSANVRITPVGRGGFRVSTRGSRGPRDGGFFLALSC